MDKEDIKLGDWQRILFGDAPAIFMVEVFLRTLVVYFALLLALRFMGKRMTGQLSVAEMAVMITLGAIVSVPMQLADRGVLLGLLVLVCALLFHQGINLWQVHSRRAEKIIEGEESLLVKDGVIQIKSLEKNRISRQQLFAALRGNGIFNLGEVRRVYLEGSGLFSIYTFEKPGPGMSTLYEMDESSFDPANGDGGSFYVCDMCGFLVERDVKSECIKCTGCGNTRWIKATN
ncbi:DUF421 domain-containing protein [Parapedobacter deserti]|uniref:DUF421 domain-containing protein n=1 Tax=Parapedobacter deserti TaxID=1912957 RepID=A0ABV7JPS8_9SPHI